MPPKKLQNLPNDCLFLILQYESGLPWRFFEIWHKLLPQFTRAVWNYRDIKHWNENLPFPGIYLYFMLRIGCKCCGYLSSAPIEGVCPVCDGKGVFYEKKTDLKKRFSLRKEEFKMFSEPVALPQGNGRGKYYLVREALHLILEGRYDGDWKTWYHALVYQEAINDRRATLKVEREAKEAADENTRRYCEMTLETNTWNLMLAHWGSKPLTLPLRLSEIHMFANLFQLDTDWIPVLEPAIPINLGRLWHHILLACTWKYACEYCPVTDRPLDTKFRIAVSKLGCKPNHWPWLLGISPQEWRMREMTIFDTQSRLDKLQVLMKVPPLQNQSPQLPVLPLNFQPSVSSSSMELSL